MPFGFDDILGIGKAAAGIFGLFDDDDGADIARREYERLRQLRDLAANPPESDVATEEAKYKAELADTINTLLLRRRMLRRSGKYGGGDESRRDEMINALLKQGRAFTGERARSAVSDRYARAAGIQPSVSPYLQALQQSRSRKYQGIEGIFDAVGSIFGNRVAQDLPSHLWRNPDTGQIMNTAQTLPPHLWRNPDTGYIMNTRNPGSSVKFISGPSATI